MKKLINLSVFTPILILLILASCKKTELTGIYEITLNGVIEDAGYTTYMYGTHIIYDNEMYALKSDSIDLDLFAGEDVLLGGSIIHNGLFGGPVYINVIEIVKK